MPFPRIFALAAALFAVAPVPAAESLRQDLPAIDGMLHAEVMGRGTVYLKSLGEGRYRLVQLGIHTVSQCTMSVAVYTHLDVHSRELEGGPLFVDGVFGEEFALFKACYQNLAELLPRLDAGFYRAHGLDAGWRLDEVGYFLVGDLERPWRWAASFARPAAKGSVEKKHFVHEAEGWKPMEAAPAFYFADYCE